MLMDFLLQRRTEIKFDVDDPLSEIMKRVADATGSKIAGFGGADTDGAISTVGFGGDAAAAAAVPAKLLQMVSKRRAPDAPAPAATTAAPEVDEGAAPPPAKRPSPDASH